MKRDEILEYPYKGVITRTVENEETGETEEIVIYSGVMDEHMVTDEEGRTMQTASYIISIPLTKQGCDCGCCEEWGVPRKGDSILLERYGETFELTVDNAEPSQLGGISIYAARNSW